MSDNLLSFAEAVGQDISNLQGRIYEGSGSPEGKIEAPVGAVYTDSAAATNGAIRWVKTSGTGNTGWRVDYGDTGWRNISPLLPSAWSGIISVSRTQNRVTIIGTNLRPAATGSTGLLDIPAGFRPTRKTNGVGDEAGAYRPVFALNFSPYKLEIRNIGAANSWVDFSITYATKDAWPSSLPGTPL